MDNIIKIKDLIEKERQRQENEICLIASENYMSKDVLNACGTVLINKYSEGYPNKRYYGGCRVIDEIEQVAIDRACELFGCKFANVQPNSGCQANQAVYMAVCKPSDTILAMGVNEGGHISHSLSIGFAGTFYNVVEYGLTDDGYLNYDELKEKLYNHRPRLLIVGGSAYPREIDFKKVRNIVDEYNAWQEENDERNAKLYNEGKISDLTPESYPQYKHCYLMVDMAHIAGLVATGEHMSPFPYANVVTSTVQKTLRSGRGGLILTNDEQLIKKINSAVFPGIQGGPLNNMIAAKAVGFGEALQPEFKQYIQQVKKNIKAMEEVFNERNVKMVSGGSDTHLILLDLRDKGISGKQLEDTLSEIGIVVNKNAIKDDPLPKTETSGIRIGTACITTRGFGEEECRWIASKICHVIDILADEENESEILNMVKEDLFEDVIDGVDYFCKKYPIYKN